MTKFTRIILLLCALSLLCLCSCHQNIPDTTSTIEETQSTDVKFTYPITPDSYYWDSYSIRTKVEMLKIPDDTLATMSNRDLVEALASYPFLIDIYLYGQSVSDGVRSVRKYCSALNELLERDGGIEAIHDYLIDESVTDLSDFERLALEDLYYVLGSAVFQGTLDDPA